MRSPAREVSPYPKPKKKPKNRRVLRARPEEPLAVWCFVRRQGVCTGRAEHRHHIAGRSDHDRTIDVCRACHGWVHANPDAAYALGFLEKRNRPCPMCGLVAGHWKGCEG